MKRTLSPADMLIAERLNEKLESNSGTGGGILKKTFEAVKSSKPVLAIRQFFNRAVSESKQLDLASPRMRADAMVSGVRGPLVR